MNSLANGTVEAQTAGEPAYRSVSQSTRNKVMNTRASGTGRRQPTLGHRDYHPGNNQAASASRRQYRGGTVRQVHYQAPHAPGDKQFPHSYGACPAASLQHRFVKTIPDFNALIKQEAFDEMASVSARFGKHYDGRKHSGYATSVKKYTSCVKKPLNTYQQNQLIPMLKNYQPTPQWSWKSLTTAFHSLTSAGVFKRQKDTYPVVKETQAKLLADFLYTVKNYHQADIDAWGIANLVWAIATLGANGLELTPLLKEAVAVLLPQVIAQKANFKPQGNTNLLWAIATLVANGLELTPALKKAVAALLPQVIAQKANFNSQENANLLWAIAKLVANGLELSPLLRETVAALLSRVIAQKVQFIPQHNANLLWAIATLAANGVKITPLLKETVAALLPQVIAQKANFTPQGNSNLLWAIATLVANGLELTPLLKEVVASLLPQVIAQKANFTPQGNANLLWAIATLVANGLELTPAHKEAVAALLSQVSTQKAKFNPQQNANLLWAMGSLGELIETAETDTVAVSLIYEPAEYHKFTPQALLMSLWGLLACNARWYSGHHAHGNNMLQQSIRELFAHVKKEPFATEQEKTTMALAASWLGLKCPVNPHYQKTTSKSQSHFHAQLKSTLPSLKIEQEKSIDALPPVDLYLPEHKLVVEVQGPFHYVGGDFQTRNGPTLLKIALLKKLGYDVIEVPVNRLQAGINRIKEKIGRKAVDDGSISIITGGEYSDEEYFTADEGEKPVDESYLTANEGLEEQEWKKTMSKRGKRKKKKNNRR